MQVGGHDQPPRRERVSLPAGRQGWGGDGSFCELNPIDYFVGSEKMVIIL